MTSPQHSRAATAASRVLVDLGQVLASYQDRLALVGGMSPTLLFDKASPPHSGSVDVDIALKSDDLGDGEYARMLSSLLDAGYRLSEDEDERFRFYIDVDLKDGLDAVVVPVDFLAPKGSKFRRNPDARFAGFRVLEADGCANAFHDPRVVKLRDKQDVRGAYNTVSWSVVAVEDLLIMKAFALNNRSKTKDAYDIVFCLDQLNQQERLLESAASWRDRGEETDVQRAIEILEEKFASTEHVGPQWHADYLDAGDRAQHQRLAYELVRAFLQESQ